MTESPNNITTAEGIRNLRKELNLTQRELAKMLGVVYAKVNRRGYGQTAPGGRRLNGLRRRRPRAGRV